MPTPTNKPIEPVKGFASIINGKIDIMSIGEERLNEPNEVEVLITPLNQSHAEEKEDPFNQNRERIFKHKWLDPKCCNSGCQSLVLQSQINQPMKILTSPPSESIKEGEREPSAEECLNWYEKAHGYCSIQRMSDGKKQWWAIYGGSKPMAEGQSLIQAIRSAMKSKAERK